MPIIRLRLAATMLAAAVCVSATPAALADGMPYPRGSVKDAPIVVPSAGPCYFRTDVGYSWSRDPDVRWTVTDPNTFLFVTDRVTKVSIDNSWFGEVGLGCGSGPHGIRGELVYGYHGKRNISGEPGPWTVPPGVDPLHTAVTTHTLMFNAYYDLGRWMDRFVPYVGAGVGTAYNITEEVYFTGNPALINRISGDERWSLRLVADGGRGLAGLRARHARLRLPLSRHGQGGIGPCRQRRLLEPQGAPRRPRRPRVQVRPALRLRRRALLRLPEVAAGSA